MNMLGVFPPARKARRSPRTAPCLLCGGRVFRLVAERDRRRRPLRTVVCETCGIVSHERIPSAAELKEYYGRRYRREYNGEVVPSARRVLRHWLLGQELAAKLDPYLPRPSDILDIGSGIGCVVRVLCDAGHRGQGIEPGEAFSDFARKRLGVACFTGTLEEFQPDRLYDAVLMVHVLEHFADPVQSLRRAARLVGPGGLLYVEVPNLAAPHSAPSRLFHFAHIYNFTPETLALACARAGWLLVEDLGGKDPRNLCWLMRRSDVPATVPPLGNGWLTTWSYLRRFSDLTYYARWSYLRRRAARAWQHWREYRTAPHLVERLLRVTPSLPAPGAEAA